MAPGSRLLAFAARWVDHGAVARVFEPLVADWQREWRTAPQRARPGVWLRGAVAFAIAFTICFPAIVMTPVPSALRQRVAVRLMTFTLFGAIVLAIPVMREVDPPWSSGWLLLFTLPWAKVLAWPFAMVSAVDAINTADGVANHVKRIAAAKLGLVATLLMIGLTGWLLPAVNQQCRVAAFTTYGFGKPPPGIRELTTYELVTDSSRATAPEPDVTNATTRARRIQREVNVRASLALLPLLVVWGRWRALRLPAGYWFSPRPTAVATAAIAIGYLAARFSDAFVENMLLLPAGTAAWFPLAILAGVSIARRKAASHLGRHVA